MSPSCEHKNCNFLIIPFFFFLHQFDSCLKPVQRITCWGQPWYPAEGRFFSWVPFSSSLLLSLSCTHQLPDKFLADPKGDVGPASSSIQLLFTRPGSCSNHRNCIQCAGSDGGADRMLTHMHRQVGTSQGSNKTPPNDAQVGERDEAEQGKIKAFLPKTAQHSSERCREVFHLWAERWLAGCRADGAFYGTRGDR